MIAILKYNAGNIGSVQNAVSRLGYSSCVTDDKDALRKAEKIIFPGVGEAGSAMKYLRDKKLDEVIKKLDQPVLGICLGMQLLCNWSEESNTECLGVFDTKVRKFPTRGIIPHMGWNDVSVVNDKLFTGIKDGSDFYFVHSYYAEPCPETVAQCEYILPFSAALKKNNYYATQFHPEKSAGCGLRLLKNFLEL